jgi:plastocyanin
MLARLAFLAVLLCNSAVARAANVNVVLIDAAGKPLADAVVMLEPTGAPLPVKPMANVQIAQHDLQFSPQVSVVTVGTAVQFPNQDTVKHHVYSYSAPKTFQIKLYAGVPHTPVVFDKPGIAVLGCNIHDGMLAWVVITDTPLWARSAAAGHAKVVDVPPGSYQVHVWHASLAETTPPQLLALTVGAGDVDQRIKLGPGGFAK